MKRAAFALAFLIPLVGCDQIASLNQKKQPSEKAGLRPSARRFVLTNFGADAAFDTQTGQLCRTWDWKLTGKADQKDPITGLTPQAKLGQLAPTCLSLYTQYPSGVDDPSPDGKSSN